MIKYNKLFDLLMERGVSTYQLRRDKLIGQGTLTNIRNGTGNLSIHTIDRLCALLNCQPSDFLEYVPDGDEQ